MTRFHFERPDGIVTDAQNILIHLNEFVPPQGFPSGVVPPTADTELIEEVAGVIDKLLYDTGTDSGFVLVEET